MFFDNFYLFFCGDRTTLSAGRTQGLLLVFATGEWGWRWGWGWGIENVLSVRFICISCGMRASDPWSRDLGILNPYPAAKRVAMKSCWTRLTFDSARKLFHFSNPPSIATSATTTLMWILIKKEKKGKVWWMRVLSRAFSNAIHFYG